jgi:lipopolysaccharide/colanic/teichoic acid biosynthesis glycosyltransferase
MLAGPIAFALRDQNFLDVDRLGPTLIYCSIGFAAGFLMLIAFDLGKDLSDYGSTREVQSVVMASLATAALTPFVVFSLTRLDFVPRSIPFIHFLMVTSLMLFNRVVATKRREHRERRDTWRVDRPQHVLLVGANRLAWFYLRMIDSLDFGRTQIVAILDDDPHLFGRSLIGHQVLAPPSELHRVVSEYKVHGVHIDRVLIAAKRPANASHSWNGLEEYCHSSDIDVGFLGDMLGIEFDAPSLSGSPSETTAPSARANFTFKRVFDFAVSLAALSAFSPIFVLVAVGLLIDVGWPVTFWQKRDGRDGRPFFLYKFRTLHAPFDRRGRFVEEDRRMSRFGLLLRRTRLDELPQLWNVLIGDMSLVGPRPLLPVDQPPTSRLRLRVLPGLTGWAQIHGGKLVSADEKGVLDDWYVEHASLWLDLQIILRTVSTVFLGDKRVDAKPPSSVSRADEPVLDDQLSAAPMIIKQSMR